MDAVTPRHQATTDHRGLAAEALVHLALCLLRASAILLLTAPLWAPVILLSGQ